VQEQRKRLKTPGVTFGEVESGDRLTKCDFTRLKLRDRTSSDMFTGENGEYFTGGNRGNGGARKEAQRVALCLPKERRFSIAELTEAIPIAQT
jgi:hypothetical protein